MHQRLQQEIEFALERSLERQRWRVDGAKVVVIFAAGAAASLTGSALQSVGPTPLAVWSSITLALAVLALLVTFLADRLTEPDVAVTLAEAQVQGLNPQETADELFRRLFKSVTFNESTVSVVLAAGLVQVVVSITSGTLSVLAMLADPVGG